MDLNDYYKLNKAQSVQFENYRKLLIEWNERMNLTAITERDEIILKHFIDSLTVLKYIPSDSKIIDIGTGAGFPGIPIKIFDESVDITLMDSLNKRINFLNTVINELNLKKIVAIHGRAEEMARNNAYREKFDIAVSRAVANFSTLLEYMIPFVRVGGKCICMKGPDVNDEVNNGINAMKQLGAELEEISEFSLPDSDIKRSIVIVKKIKSTAKAFPRKAGIPSKKPL